MINDHLDQRQKMMIEANQLFSTGNYPDALKKISEVHFKQSEQTSLDFGYYLNTLGSIHAEMRNNAEARKYFILAHGIYKAHKDFFNLTITLFNIGNTEFYSGDYIAARQNYFSALNIAKDKGYKELEIKILQNYLNNFYESEPRTEMFIDALHQIRTLYKNEALEGLRLYSYYRLEAKVSMDASDIVSQEKYLLLAISIIQEHKLSESYEFETNYFLGLFYKRIGRYQEALDKLQRSYSYAKRTQDGYLLDITFGLADALAFCNRVDDAKVIYESGIEIIDSAISQYDDFKRLHFTQSVAHFVEMYIIFLLEHQDYIRAFEISEIIQGRLIHDLIFNHNIKVQTGSRIKVGSGGRIRLATYSISEILLEARKSETNFLKFLFLNGQKRLVCWLISAEIGMMYWDATESLPLLLSIKKKVSPPFNFNEIQSTNTPDGMIGLYNITYNILSKKLMADMNNEFTDLAVVLFPKEVADYFKEKKGKLCIVPHEDLNEFPFSAITLAVDHPLCMNWQISLTASLGCFIQNKKERDYKIVKAQANNGALNDNPLIPSVLLIGDCSSAKFAAPLFSKKSSFIGVPSEQKMILAFDFPHLPGTVLEIEKISEVVPSTKLVGRNATTASVIGQFSKHDIIHFATHGFHHPFEPEYSFVVLDDGRIHDEGVIGLGSTLFAGSVKDLLTNAELVVLSACSTALGHVTTDSHISLAQSFCIAGARCVLTSLWPVNDRDVVFFMEYFYKGLKVGYSISEAFQKTQMHFFKIGNPIFASFQLIGRAEYALYRSGELNNNASGSPAFCGGDIVCMNFEVGEFLDLNKYNDLTQDPYDGFLIDKNSGILKFRKNINP